VGRDFVHADFRTVAGKRDPSCTRECDLSVACLGIFPTAVGYVLWSYALSRAAVSTVTGSLNVLPIVSLVIAWLWLGGLATITGVIVLSSRGKAEQRKLPMPVGKKVVGDVQ